MPKDIQPVRGSKRASSNGGNEDHKALCSEDPLRETQMQLGYACAPSSSRGPDTKILSDKHTEGKISLYCYINLTNKLNTVTNTEQIKCQCRGLATEGGRNPVRLLHVPSLERYFYYTRVRAADIPSNPSIDTLS